MEYVFPRGPRLEQVSGGGGWVWSVWVLFWPCYWFSPTLPHLRLGIQHPEGSEHQVDLGLQGELKEFQQSETILHSAPCYQVPWFTGVGHSYRLGHVRMGQRHWRGNH